MLTAGATLAHYTILGPLGAGAMGEVYRARDTRLGREVAIKVLPEHFADDEERLRRFEREAKALASLNHPNVAQIHGVDQVGDTCFLVLELVEGETLAERLERGRLPLDEALDVCRQIAEGLEAAHEAGVIHRDLKPANVRLTPEGKVKVLDFGLAKPTREGRPGSSTDSVLSTEAGRLLGTPTYMAPEQARGKAIDRRVDVWAFGCVLYECLTGKRAFDGETMTDVFAAVIEREPDWRRLPPGTSPRVVELLHRCLAKDARRRLRDVGDARLELESGASALPRAAGGTGASRRALGLVAMLALLLGAGLGALVGLRAPARGADGAAAEPRKLRASIELPGLEVQVYPRIAPDGRSFVHRARVDGVSSLYRRSFDAEASVPLAGTEDPGTCCFSPDGSALAVMTNQSELGGRRTLVRVDLAGSRPSVVLGTFPPGTSNDSGIVWLPDGRIVGAVDPEQLVIFRADGNAEPVLVPIERTLEDPGEGIGVFRALPDGHHVLGRTYSYDGRGYTPAVVAVDVDTRREKVLLRNAEHGAVFGDTLLFSRSDVLLQVPFDAERLEVTGEPTPIVHGMRTQNFWQSAWFDVARDGTLLWMPGGVQGSGRKLELLAPDGQRSPWWEENLHVESDMNVAPDGSFLCFNEVAESGLLEVWGSEVDPPIVRRLFAKPSTDIGDAQPLPGGREVVFLRRGRGGPGAIVRASIEDPGREEVLFQDRPGSEDIFPVRLWPDGSRLLVFLQDSANPHFAVLGIEPGGSRELRTLALPLGEIRPVISSDGEWIAYDVAREGADRPGVRRLFEDGRLGAELPVQGIPAGQTIDMDWRPGDAGGDADGNAGGLELVFLLREPQRIVVIPFEPEPSPRFGPPRTLCELAEPRVENIAVLPGGRILLHSLGASATDPDGVELAFGLLRVR